MKQNRRVKDWADNFKSTRIKLTTDGWKPTNHLLRVFTDKNTTVRSITRVINTIYRRYAIFLTLKITSAQVGETLANVNNSYFQNYIHLDDYTRPRTPISNKVASVMHDLWSLFHRPQSIMFAINKCIDRFSRKRHSRRKPNHQKYTFALVLRLHVR